MHYDVKIVSTICTPHNYCSYFHQRSECHHQIRSDSLFLQIFRTFLSTLKDPSNAVAFAVSNLLWICNLYISNSGVFDMVPTVANFMGSFVFDIPWFSQLLLNSSFSASIIFDFIFYLFYFSFGKFSFHSLGIFFCICWTILCFYIFSQVFFSFFFKTWWGWWCCYCWVRESSMPTKCC